MSGNLHFHAPNGALVSKLFLKFVNKKDKIWTKLLVCRQREEVAIEILLAERKAKLHISNNEKTNSTLLLLNRQGFATSSDLNLMIMKLEAEVKVWSLMSGLPERVAMFVAVSSVLPPQILTR